MAILFHSYQPCRSRQPNSLIFSPLIYQDRRGRIIACENLGLIDGGSTAWLEGLRVHPDHRGRKLASRLQSFLVDYASQLAARNSPGKDVRPLRIRLATTEDNAPSMHLAEKLQLRVLHKWSYTFLSSNDFTPRIGTITRQLEQMGGDDEIRREGLDELSKIDEVGVLLLDWKAFESSCPEHLKKLELERPGANIELMVARAKETGEVKGFSVGRTRPSISTIPEKKGERIRLATLMTKRGREDCIVTLLKHELEKSRNDSAQSLLLNLDERATNWARTYGLLPTDENDGVGVVLLYEKKL